jgi:hypothetical protein
VVHRRLGDCISHKGAKAPRTKIPKHEIRNSKQFQNDQNT